MKTKQQVESELHRIGNLTIGSVFTTEEFGKICADGGINENDGFGYFHDGESKTDIDCFDMNPFSEAIQKRFPYVIWYNK